MSYFNNFPTVEVDVFGNGSRILLTDIVRKVRFSDLAIQNNVQYDFYDVQDGETPEELAHYFFGDPLLHWIILLSNNIKDRYEDWPMSIAQFESYVTEKYADVNGVHHYEISQTSGDTTKTIEIPNDSANTIPVDAVTVTNYEYEENLQEQKRKIRIVKSEYIKQIKQELKSRLRGN